MTNSIPEPGSEVEYRPEIDTYRATFAHGTIRPSVAVIETIASIKNCDVEALDPLYGVVNPTSLDKLFQPTTTGNHLGNAEVTFEYHSYEINIKSCGEILIQPANLSE